MKESYITANAFPTKLLHAQTVKYGKILPYHIVINPTNKCNGGCKECFCSNIDRKKELPISEIKNIISYFRNLGTRAVSISGGGEPFLYPEINEMINYISRKGLLLGGVTNGKTFEKVTNENLQRFEWLRVSATTSKPLDLRITETNIYRAPEVDWSLSYVLGNENFGDLENLILFSNRNSHISHVRVVTDLRNIETDLTIKAKRYIQEKRIGADKVIWQTRTSDIPGVKNCYFSLLKPTIDAEGYIQPCCSYQFATNPPLFSVGKDTAFCHWTEYGEKIANQETFDGSNCVNCQYDKYNDLLGLLLNKPKHSDFV